jgi:tetratricopeptide (TPR) repeat protein
MRVQLATDRRDLTGADDLAHVAAASIDRAGAPRRLVALLQRTRALIAYARGQLAEAAKLLAEARASFAAVAGERSLDVAAVESALGSVARARGDLDAAERHHRAALALDRALRGERHLDVARDLHNVAGVLRLRKQLDAALATYTEALRIEVELRGESSIEAGLTCNSLGLVKMARGDWAAARDELERAAAALEQAGHGDRAFAAHNLGIVHAAVKDHKKALVAFDHAASIYATTIGPDALAPIRLHLDRARSLAALGEAAARTEAMTAITAADRAHIRWIADDARALLAQLPRPVNPASPPIAIEPLPRQPAQTGRPAPTQLKPPEPPRDIGVYGSGLPRGNWNDR